jgi:hypothetical protein
MMRHSRWIILSVILFQTLCYGTSIVVVVSETGEYVVLAADSRETETSGKRKPSDKVCKVMQLDDTLFFDAGTVVIGTRQGHPWNSKQVAKEIYRASKTHEAQALSIAWGKRALAWFSNSTVSDLQSVVEPDGTLVTGGFINFHSDNNPSSVSQTLYFDGKLPLRVEQQNIVNGKIGVAGIHHELVDEFKNAQTPRALKAHGSLKIHDVGEDLSYDIEFARRAVQFVIDNVPDKEKNRVHGPIDVVIFRRMGGIEWFSRKPNCYSRDLHPTVKEKASQPKTTGP